MTLLMKGYEELTENEMFDWSGGYSSGNEIPVGTIADYALDDGLWVPTDGNKMIKNLSIADNAEMVADFRKDTQDMVAYASIAVVSGGVAGVIGGGAGGAVGALAGYGMHHLYSSISSSAYGQSAYGQ